MKNRFKNIMRAKSYQSRQNYPNSAAPSKIGFGPDGKERRGRDADDWIGDAKKAVAVEKITQMNSRFREVLRETLIENNRKNNFIRIYPTSSSDVYDQYFTQQKPMHKSLYKALFSNELIPYQTTYPQMANSSISKSQSKTDVTDDDQNSSVPTQVPPGNMLSPEKPSAYLERSTLQPGSTHGKGKFLEGSTESRGLSLHPTIPEEKESTCRGAKTN